MSPLPVATVGISASAVAACVSAAAAVIAATVAIRNRQTAVRIENEHRHAARADRLDEAHGLVVELRNPQGPNQLATIEEAQRRLRAVLARLGPSSLPLTAALPEIPSTDLLPAGGGEGEWAAIQDRCDAALAEVEEAIGAH